jgi:putative transposase
MSYVKILIHLVFATKYRNAFLSKDIREEVFEHIRIHSAAKGIFVKAIGGYVDHVHCLLSLGSMQTMADVAQLIKGESSFWINKNRICSYRFTWQDDYYAVSVGESQLPRVIAYIGNQERHHAKQTWEEEEQKFIDKYGFKKITDKQNQLSEDNGNEEKGG